MNTHASPARVPPVLQFVLLMIPIVVNSFFLIFSLVGLFIEGRDKEQWAIEVDDVAFNVGAPIVLYCLLVLLYIYYRRAGFKQLLAISSYIHIVLALIFSALIIYQT